MSIIKNNKLALSKVVISLILPILLCMINLNYQMKFSFILEPKKLICLGEHLTENLSSTFNIVSDISYIRTRIIDPNGNTIYNKENRKELAINFNPYTTGIHQICIDNFNKDKTKLSFEYLYGVAVKDYSGLVKALKIKPAELNLMKLLDSIKIISKEFSSLMSKESLEKSSYHEKLSSKMTTFSIIFLSAIIIVNLFEYVYLKSYINKRKYI